ncbi:MAG: flippase [Deltaproteobacteria bacterium]|nr:flippase [Deltaproteobacteria bacterium]
MGLKTGERREPAAPRASTATDGGTGALSPAEGVGRRVVAQNALFLVLSQIVTAILSFAVTALLARHLGAQNYGVFYVAFSFVQSVFILVELGQDFYVVRAVSRDRDRAGEYFGTGLALRAAATAAVYIPVMGAAHVLGYEEATRSAIALMVLFHFTSSLGNGFSVIYRGAERMEFEAVSRVAFRTVVAAATVIAILLDGGILTVIEAQVLGAAAALPLLALILRRLGVPRPTVNLRTAREILRGGVPFLFYGIVTTAHAAIDAIMLSKLAPAEVVGWYGAAIRFVGILIFPATILAAALFPTLSRLFISRPEGYRLMTATGLRAMLLLGMPIAAGTWLFAEQAVSLAYGLEDFSNAVTILKVLSPYFILVFINIILGTAIMAANRQSAWASSKGLCVLLVIGLNAALIPLCQTRFGNGGIGSASAMLFTEVVMLVAAFLLIPRATLVPALWRDLGRILAAVAGMIGVAWLLRGVSSAITIPASGAAYVALIFLLGGIDREDVALLRDVARIGSRGAIAGGR